MANLKRDPGREAFWRQSLIKFRKSRLSVREFCRREKLHVSAFYFWRRTLQQRGAKQGRGKPPAFVPLVLGDAHAAAGITLELRGGRSLRLSESFSVERLAVLVFALEAAEGKP
jgi:hypothetical protein